MYLTILCCTETLPTIVVGRVAVPSPQGILFILFHWVSCVCTQKRRMCRHSYDFIRSHMRHTSNAPTRFRADTLYNRYKIPSWWLKSRPVYEQRWVFLFSAIKCVHHQKSALLCCCMDPERWHWTMASKIKLVIENKIWTKKKDSIGINSDVSVCTRLSSIVTEKIQNTNVNFDAKTHCCGSLTIVNNPLVSSMAKMQVSNG